MLLAPRLPIVDIFLREAVVEGLSDVFKGFAAKDAVPEPTVVDPVRM